MASRSERAVTAKQTVEILESGTYTDIAGNESWDNSFFTGVL